MAAYSPILRSARRYGATTFTLVVIITNLKLMLNQYQFPWFSIFATIFSISAWFGTAFGFSNLPMVDLNGYKVFDELVLNYSFWLTITIIVVGLLARDYFFKGWQRAFRPQLHHVLQELVRLGKKDEPIHIPPAPQPRM